MAQFPSISGASGIWSLTDVRNSLMGSNWPLMPPEGNTAAWFAGGSPGHISTVNRITFATDTATATVRGPLSVARANLVGAGNFTDGWFSGGQLSTVQRITYATDTATALIRGPLTAATYAIASVGNDTYAWFGGGYNVTRSTINRITYATDTDTASVRGPFSAVRYSMSAAGNSDYGWFGGGYFGGGAAGSSVQRITYATDTATPSPRGPLSSGIRGEGAAGNTTDSWWAGGRLPGGGSSVSRVDRITYATDTTTATTRGPLNNIRVTITAAGGTTDGWHTGGQTGNTPGDVSTVERITYATDTATASVRGPLSLATAGTGGAAGIQ